MKIHGVIIELTNKCNYNCIMCPNSKQTREKGIMSMKTFKKIIDSVEPGYVNFNMLGESLIDKNLIDKIEYARKKHPTPNFTIYTNASLPIGDLINSSINLVCVSFYGHDRETYKKIHRIDNFDKVLKNIKDVLKDKIIILCNHIKGMNNPERVRELFRGYRFISYPIHTFAGGIDLEGREKDCEIMKGILVFHWNGDVTTCCMDYDGKNVFGNINKKPLIKIMEDFHKAKSPVCETCSIGKSIGGIKWNYS